VKCLQGIDFRTLPEKIKILGNGTPDLVCFSVIKENKKLCEKIWSCYTRYTLTLEFFIDIILPVALWPWV